jgi:hypothetical protein
MAGDGEAKQRVVESRAKAKAGVLMEEAKFERTPLRHECATIRLPTHVRR